MKPYLGEISRFVAATACQPLREARCSFLKKRSKKLLTLSALAFPDRARPNSWKFFGSFFQKRTAFCRLPWLS
jgi:hypothetical protein